MISKIFKSQIIKRLPVYRFCEINNPGPKDPVDQEKKKEPTQQKQQKQKYEKSQEQLNQKDNETKHKKPVALKIKQNLEKTQKPPQNAQKPPQNAQKPSQTPIQVQKKTKGFEFSFLQNNLQNIVKVQSEYDNLNEEIDSLLKQEQSEEQLKQLINCYDKQCDHKNIENIYQQIQKLKYAKDENVENIMLLSYINTNSDKAIQFLEYLDENKIQIKIDHLNQAVNNFALNDDMMALKKLSQIIQKNYPKFRFPDLRCFGNFLNENNYSVILLEKIQIFNNFLKFNNNDRLKIDPSFKKAVRIMVEYNYPSQKLTNNGQDLQLIIFQTLSKLQLLNIVDLDVFQKFFKSQLLNNNTFGNIQNILSNIQDNQYYHQNLRFLVATGDIHFSDDIIHDAYDKLKTAYKNNQNLNNSNYLLFLIDVSLYNGIYSIITDIFENQKLFSKCNLTLNHIYLQTQKCINLMSLQDYMKPQAKLNAEKIEKNINYDIQDAALIKIQTMARNNQSSEIVSVFYNEFIEKTIVNYQKKKSILFQDVLNQITMEEYQTPFYINSQKAFFEKVKDKEYFDFFMSEQSDNAFIETFIKEPLGQYQEQQFQRFLYKKINKMFLGDHLMIRHWLTQNFKLHPEFKWMKKLHDNWDKISEQNAKQQVIFDQAMKRLGTCTEVINAFIKDQKACEEIVKNGGEQAVLRHVYRRVQRITNQNKELEDVNFEVRDRQSRKFKKNYRINMDEVNSVIQDAYNIWEEDEAENSFGAIMEIFAGLDKSYRLNDPDINIIDDFEKDDLCLTDVRIHESIDEFMSETERYHQLYSSVKQHVSLIDDQNIGRVQELLQFALKSESNICILLCLKYFDLTKIKMAPHLFEQLKYYLDIQSKKEVVQNLTFTGPIPVKRIMEQQADQI